MVINVSCSQNSKLKPTFPVFYQMIVVSNRFSQLFLQNKWKDLLLPSLFSSCVFTFRHTISSCCTTWAEISSSHCWSSTNVRFLKLDVTEVARRFLSPACLLTLPTFEAFIIFMERVKSAWQQQSWVTVVTCFTCCFMVPYPLHRAAFNDRTGWGIEGVGGEGVAVKIRQLGWWKALQGSPLCYRLLIR